MGKTQEVRVNIRDLLTSIHVGIHPHERGRVQRVCINMELVGNIPVHATTIADCINYDPIYALVVEQWPLRPHVELLENLLAELIDFSFRSDSRLTRLIASVTKPDIFTQAASVGVEIEKTRAQWEQDNVI